MTENRPSTAERVKAVCNDLYARHGTKPSVRQVLATLPDIRSTSTVHKPYAEWWKEVQASERAMLEQRGISDDFVKALMSEVSRFNRESDHQHQAATAQAIEQRDQALEDLARVEALYRESSEESGRSKTQLESMVQSLQTDLESAKQAHTATIGELRGQLASANDTVASLTKDNERLRTEVATTAVQLESKETILLEVKATAAHEKAENERLREELTTATNASARLESAVEGHTRLVEQLRSAEARYERTLADLNTDKVSLTDTIAELRGKLEGTQDALADARSTLAATERVNDELRESVNRMAKGASRTEGGKSVNPGDKGLS